MFPRVQSDEEFKTCDLKLLKRISDFQIKYPTGRVYWWVDVAIVNPAAPTLIKNGSDTAEYIDTNIEESREEIKIARILPPDQAGCFIPFVVKVTGRLGRCAQAGRYCTDVTSSVYDWSSDERIANLWQYTAHAIAITTVRLMLRC